MTTIIKMTTICLLNIGEDWDTGFHYYYNEDDDNYYDEDDF